MAASQLDILIEQGSTFAWVFEVQNKDLTTGYTWAMKIRNQHAGAEVISLTSPTSLVIAKSGNHTHATTSVSAATTATLSAPAMHVYVIEYTQTSTGTVTRAFEGSVFVTPEATK